MKINIFPFNNSYKFKKSLISYCKTLKTIRIGWQNPIRTESWRRMNTLKLRKLYELELLHSLTRLGSLSLVRNLRT